MKHFKLLIATIKLAALSIARTNNENGMRNFNNLSHYLLLLVAIATFTSCSKEDQKNSAKDSIATYQCKDKQATETFCRLPSLLEQLDRHQRKRTFPLIDTFHIQDRHQRQSEQKRKQPLDLPVDSLHDYPKVLYRGKSGISSHPGPALC